MLGVEKELAVALAIVFGTSSDSGLTSSSKVPFFNNKTVEGSTGFFPDGLATVQKFAEVLGVKQSSYLTQGASASFERGRVVCLSKTMKNLLVLVKASTTESDTVIMNFGTNTADVSVSWNNNETVITNNNSGNLSYTVLL